MNKIGIIVNRTKDTDLKITDSIVKWAKCRKKTPMLAEDEAQRLDIPKYGVTRAEILSDSDFIVVLGGDGTILNAARDASVYETPVLGINLGHLGFLAEVEIENMFKSLDMVINGNITIESRFMFEASLCSKNKKKVYNALNDVVISRGALLRVIKINVYINDEMAFSLNGDGLIVSTPTGSTAYSLSAGGPILSPDLSVMSLTPVCPLSLFDRSSIVISGDELIKADLIGSEGDAILSIDGQAESKIEPDEKVIIKKAPYKAQFIKLAGSSFYNVLRNKLSER
jgi:NAD+ kinase